MPHYYPIFLNLGTSTCLVVGAGAVGARKAAGLIEAGATVRLVAPDISEAAAELISNPLVEFIHGAYNVKHLESASLAFAATANRLVNAAVVADARERNIPVTSADSPEEGNFIVPSTMRRGDLCIAVSTGGASPSLAARIREELETQYGMEYTPYVELLSAMRSYIKELSNNPKLRLAAHECLMEHGAELRLLLRDKGADAASDEARRVVNELRALSPE